MFAKKIVNTIRKMIIRLRKIQYRSRESLEITRTKYEKIVAVMYVS